MNSVHRKKQLIAQGAIYRAEALLAKQDLQGSIRPHSLAHSAFNTVAASAFSAFRKYSSARLAGVGIETFLPLLTSGAAALVKRKSLLKPVLRGTLIIGAVATTVALISSRRKKTRQDGSEDNE